MPSILEQYHIADFVEWEKQKALEINPDFQRGSVWKPFPDSFPRFAQDNKADA